MKIMQVRTVREALRSGRSIFDLSLRVTFYARVSTEKDAQLNSLDNQIQYYTEFIKSKPGWMFVPGYIDEGLSGTSTKKRDNFNRMISDAKAGCFDFIITKEISRFSRSTLDSIKYTQELFDYGVGVFFQGDNINTLDADSEFRLVVMAGVAQDEVRKLSERLKFGFRQAVKNGHVLGNNTLWGYDKKKCVLTVKEEEAEVVRTVFDLYANRKMGIRRISQALTDMGYTSRQGNEFNVLTIRHILENPKYKGWYCGNKTKSLDYRTGKKEYLQECEWIMYPDSSIPAIVSEELWDRANALYKRRSQQMLQHSCGAAYHNRYAYSGKIICEEHGTSLYRQVLHSASGDKEVWQCRVYRQRGRAACSAPQLYTAELNQIMGHIFCELIQSKQAIVDAVLTVIASVPEEAGDERTTAGLEKELTQLRAKKDRLLELSMADAISVQEFRARNEGFNNQLAALEEKLAGIRKKEAEASGSADSRKAIRAALERELDFSENINADLVAAVLDHIILLKRSTKDEVHLRIVPEMGDAYEAIYTRKNASFRCNRLRNTMRREPIRRI